MTGLSRICARRLVAVTAFALLAPCQVLAQATPSASQLTPETMRPDDTGVSGGVAFPGAAPLDVPPGAGGLAVTVASVRFDGEYPDMAPSVARLVAEIVGHRRTVAELYAFAAAVESLYAASGYVLARVVIPAQTLLDGGVLTLVVVDGFIEDVDVSALSPHVREVVAQRLASLVGRARVTLDEIERRVLLAADVPGLRLRSTLARGETQGGTLLILDGAHRLTEGDVNVNNYLSSSYGRWQFATQAAVNSALGAGEQVYGSYIGSDDPESTLGGQAPLRIFGVGAVIPIGVDGVTLNPEYTHSRSRPLLDPGVLATEDVFERFAVRLAYPLILTRARRLDLQAAYEHIGSATEATDFDVELNRDRYSVLRLSAEFGTSTASGAPVFVSATFSQGLGGRDEADARASGLPLSRMGSSPDFSKLVAEAHYVQPLPHAFRAHLSARGQTSFGAPLFDSEQFALDGVQSVSGFDSGTFSVDQGILMRAELSRTVGLPYGEWASAITPYVFGAAGRGWLAAPTVLEPEVIDAASIGIGVRAFAETADGAPGGSIGFELARRFTDDARAEEGYRAMFNAGVRF